MQATAPSFYACRTPAKINLHLEVFGRRADGFHEIESILTAVSLFDQLSFSPTEDAQLSVVCLHNRPGQRDRIPTIPDGPHNLAWRALDRLRQAVGKPRLGGHLQIVKQIPPEAGLGGGSSDAAAAMMLAIKAWRLTPDRTQFEHVSATIGSDVPFFFTGRTALCRGRGEIVQPLPHRRPLWFVVVRPDFGLSTQQVFTELELDRPARKYARLASALSSTSLKNIGQLIFNRLRDTACQIQPELRGLLTEIKRTNCWAAEMTGSGSACFGLYPARCLAWRKERLADSISQLLGILLPFSPLDFAAGTGFRHGSSGRAPLSLHLKSDHSAWILPRKLPKSGPVRWLMN